MTGLPARESVRAACSSDSTFVLGLCVEEGWPEGWALAVECSTVSGVGDALSLFDGGMLDDSIRDAAYVALALVKTRQHTLRRWLGVSDPQQGQDLRAPNKDVNLQINPSLYPRSGGSSEPSSD